MDQTKCTIPFYSKAVHHSARYLQHMLCAMVCLELHFTVQHIELPLKMHVAAMQTCELALTGI